MDEQKNAIKTKGKNQVKMKKKCHYFRFYFRNDEWNEHVTNQL